MNKNIKQSRYEAGEIVFGIQSPGAGWIKLDGTARQVSTKIASKLVTINWNTQTSTFGASNIISVAYANGTWVAGGTGGALRTSTNATTWVTQTSQFGATTIFSVAYGNGTWVAGGTGGTLRTSTNNGVTWNTQTSNFGTSIINTVAYGNGTWVAGGANGAVRTSTDAINWNTQTIPGVIGSSVQAIAYGGNIFIVGSPTIRGLSKLSDALYTQPMVPSSNVVGNVQ